MGVDEFVQGGIWNRDAVRQRQRAIVDSTARWTPRPYDYLGDPLTPALVSRYEAEFGIELPFSYRSFLLETGDGGIGPGFGMRNLGRPINDDAPWNPGEIDVDSATPDLLMSTDFDPIAGSVVGRRSWLPGVRYLFDHGCALWDVLVIGGEHAGEVFFDGRSDATGLSRYELDESGELVRHPVAVGQHSLDFADHYCWWLGRSVGSGARSSFE